MVVAQFTAVSLQKDDRAFVKYDSTNRRYSGIAFSKQTGSLLSSESSSQLSLILSSECSRRYIRDDAVDTWTAGD